MEGAPRPNNNSRGSGYYGGNRDRDTGSSYNNREPAD